MPRVRLLLLAVAGAVCGHTLAYTVSYPDGAARESVLRVTGHAYWHAAIAAAVLGGAWFAASHALKHFRSPRQRHALLWPVLPALQVAVYAGMEVSERVAAGAPLAGILDHVLVGLASQLLVAAVLAVAVYFIGRGAAVAGRWFAAVRAADQRPAFIAAPHDGLPVRLAVIPCGSRSPPSS